MTSDERLVVALVRGVRGLRGEVRVEVLTDRPDERFAPGSVVHVEGRDDPLTIETASPVADGPGWWIRFREIPDRTAADGLRDRYLDAVVDARTTLAADAVYWHEVVGATVRDTADRILGTVEDVYRVGGAEVIVVRGEAYGAFDVPIVRDIVRTFAPRQGEIVVDTAALGLDDRIPPSGPGPEGER